MELEFDCGSLLSTAGGGGIALLLCKAMLTKALRDLESITVRLNEIFVNLLVLNTKFEQFDKMHDIVKDHDRLLTKLETRLHHENEKNRIQKYGKARMS